MMVAAVDNRTDITQIICRECTTVHAIIYNREDMLSWLCGNEAIQDALPYLSASDRELLLSNTCGSCFDKMFPPLDTDD